MAAIAGIDLLMVVDWTVLVHECACCLSTGLLLGDVAFLSTPGWISPLLVLVFFKTLYLHFPKHLWLETKCTRKSFIKQFD